MSNKLPPVKGGRTTTEWCEVCGYNPRNKARRTEVLDNIRKLLAAGKMVIDKEPRDNIENKRCPVTVFRVVEGKK